MIKRDVLSHLEGWCAASPIAKSPQCTVSQMTLEALAHHGIAKERGSIVPFCPVYCSIYEMRSGEGAVSRKIENRKKGHSEKYGAYDENCVDLFHGHLPIHSSEGHLTLSYLKFGNFVRNF